MDPIEGLKSEESDRKITKEEFINDLNMNAMSNQDQLQIRSMLSPDQFVNNTMLSGYKTRECEHTQSN